MGTWEGVQKREGGEGKGEKRGNRVEGDWCLIYYSFRSKGVIYGWAVVFYNSGGTLVAVMAALREHPLRLIYYNTTSVAQSTGITGRTYIHWCHAEVGGEGEGVRGNL